MCSLKWSVPPGFSSRPHLVRVHVIEGHDTASNVIRKWILLVGILKNVVSMYVCEFISCKFPL